MRKSSAQRLGAVLALLGLLFGAIPVHAASPGDLVYAAAGELSPDIRPVTVKFEGLVQQCATRLPAAWLIADQSVTVTDKTTISPPLYTPVAGDYAIVTALREDTQLTATRIIVVAPDSAATRSVEFRSVITALPRGSAFQGVWTVGGVLVTVSPRTQIEGDPVLGHYAQVVGWLKLNRDVEAVSITVVDPADELSHFEFRGTIQAAIGASCRVLTVSGVTGILTVDALEGTPRIGAVADVRGYKLPAGTLLFERVHVLADAQGGVRLRGAIQAMDATTRVWDVGGIRVLLNDLSFVDEVRGRAAPGMLAEVIAVQWGEQLYALRVRVERPE